MSVSTYPKSKLASTCSFFILHPWCPEKEKMDLGEDAEKAINHALERAGYMEYQLLEARVLRKLQEEMEELLSSRDSALSEIRAHRQSIQQMVEELVCLDKKLSKEADSICTHFDTCVAELRLKYTNHLRREKARLKSVSYN